MLVKLFELYITYFKIGLLAFGGGYATIPLIEQYIVYEKNYITLQNLSDIITISQMTPGPIAINSATFVGSFVYGIIGSIIATTAVITPQIILLITFYNILEKDNKIIKILLNGINICVCALILIVSVNLIKSSIFINFEILPLIIFILSIVLYYLRINIIKIILLNICFTTIYLFIF